MDEVRKVADDKYEWVDGKRVKPDWRYWYERARWWAAKAKEFGYCPDRGVLQASDRFSSAQQEVEPVSSPLAVICAGQRLAAIEGTPCTGSMRVVWHVELPPDTRIYTAPQPRIDLSQFREAVKCWADYTTVLASSAMRGGANRDVVEGYERDEAEAMRLLALIAEQEGK